MTRFLIACLLFLASTAAAADPAKLESTSWLVGRWHSPDGERMESEEHWSAASGGAMVGMFRLVSGGRPGIYELLLLEQESDGVWMRLRHFRPQMVAMEQEPISFKLTSATPEKLVFENPKDNKPKRVAYALTGDDLLVTIETEREGKPSAFAVKLRRVK